LDSTVPGAPALRDGAAIIEYVDAIGQICDHLHVVLDPDHGHAEFVFNAQNKTGEMQLESEIARLGVEKQCLAACAAGHRAHFERERERSETLVTETLKLGGVAMSARERAARLEAELAGRRGGGWWRRPISQKKAASELPPHGRKALSPVLVGVPVRA
jgi:hypothetical protein